MATTDYPGSGGTRYKLYRTGSRISADIPFLASERYTAKRSGCTFKQASSTAAVNEVQSISANGASAGTFTITVNGATTSALAYTATNTTVQTALRALSTVGATGVTVTGGPANTTALTLTFGGTLAGQNVGLVQVNRAGLTGATGGVASETTRGSALGVAEIRKGTFVIPDPSNPGYYRPWATGDTIDDVNNPISGYLFESINVADGDVTEGILIQGSVLKARVQPAPIPAAIITACAGRITFQ